MGEPSVDFVDKGLEAGIPLCFSLFAPLAHELLERAPHLVEVGLLGHHGFVLPILFSRCLQNRYLYLFIFIFIFI
jgi:hypothetical protein